LPYMTATGECTIAWSRCAKKTPVPSGAIIEYAMYRSSPTAAMEGGGRSHPAELTSVVSMATGDVHVRPESADVAMYNPALLSARTPHQTARTRVVPHAARIDFGHIPATLIGGTGKESRTKSASPTESTTRRLAPATRTIPGSPHSTGGESHAANATRARMNSGDRMARTVARQIRFSYIQRDRVSCWPSWSSRIAAAARCHAY
jgi:hypothetical protein